MEHSQHAVVVAAAAAVRAVSFAEVALHVAVPETALKKKGYVFRFPPTSPSQH